MKRSYAFAENIEVNLPENTVPCINLVTHNLKNNTQNKKTR